MIKSDGLYGWWNRLHLTVGARWVRWWSPDVPNGCFRPGFKSQISAGKSTFQSTDLWRIHQRSCFWQGCDIAKRKIVTVDCWNVFIWNGHVSKTCQSFKQLGPNMSYKCRSWSLFAVHSFLDDFALSVIRTHPNARIADLLQDRNSFPRCAGTLWARKVPCGALCNCKWRVTWQGHLEWHGWHEMIPGSMKSQKLWPVDDKANKNVLFAILGVQYFLSRLEYRHEQMWGGGCISSKIPWSFQKIPKCHECDGRIFWSSRLECVWSKLHTALVIVHLPGCVTRALLRTFNWAVPQW
jgi:hypothetical protein